MNSVKRLGLLAALAMAVAGSASATVITTNPNLTIPNNSIGLYVNFLNGSTYTGPNTFPAAGGPGFNWDLNIFGATTFTLFWSGSTTSGHSTTQANTGYGIVSTAAGQPGLALVPGSTIGSSSVFSASTSLVNITTGQPVYIGIRFWNEGADLTTAADDTVHYGYALVQLTNGQPGTLLSYAYESTPGAAITIPVPEPSTYALLAAAGGLGLVLNRRRKSA